MTNHLTIKSIAALSAAFCLSTPLWALRVVSLLPSNTEIVEALGAGNDVLGVTLFEHNPRYPARESVGDFISPSMEKIVALKPDVILAGAWQNSRVVPELRRLGYSVIEVKNPRSMEEIYQSIVLVARALNQPAAAEPVITDMRRRLAALKSARPGRPLRTYIEIDRPLWTVGGHDFLSEALCDAGACNLFDSIRQEAAQVSAEAIVEKNPELIISLVASKEEIAHRPGWDRIEAVRRGWVIDDVSADRLSHPSPRLIEGLEAVAQRIRVFESHQP